MKTFNKWHNKPIEDWGAVMSDDAKSFYRAFKNYLKRAFPDAEVIGFKPNHYDASGFLRFGETYIYISHSINRFSIDRGRGDVDFNDSSCMNGVLFRTSPDAGYRNHGRNHFTNIYNLEKDVRLLVESPEGRRAA